ncbi:MAG TPA: hypothetical protein VNK95_02040 [Caldilineaceae bacterium]|nr:hypothetical protein [Caldilineaceae bacterium]
MAALYVLVVGGATQAWIDLFYQHSAFNQQDVRGVVLSSARLSAAPAIACSFELVVIDIENTTDALSLCRRLRALYRGALLLLVADIDARLLCEAQAAGVDECIARSADSRQLRAALLCWCDRIRQANSLE